MKMIYNDLDPKTNAVISKRFMSVVQLHYIKNNVYRHAILRAEGRNICQYVRLETLSRDIRILQWARFGHAPRNTADCWGPTSLVPCPSKANWVPAGLHFLVSS